MNDSKHPMHIGIAKAAKGYVISAEFMHGYEIYGTYRTLKAAKAALKAWKRVGDEISAALAGDPVAISNTCKQVERLRKQEEDNHE